MSDPKAVWKMPGGITDADTGRGEVAGFVPAHGGGRLRTPWQKGQSGRPKDFLPTAYMLARRACADASPEAIRRQIELMSSDDDRVALMACEAVLRRGVGQPRDHSDEERAGGRINLSGLSGAELQTLASLLRKALNIG